MTGCQAPGTHRDSCHHTHIFTWVLCIDIRSKILLLGYGLVCVSNSGNGWTVIWTVRCNSDWFQLALGSSFDLITTVLCLNNPGSQEMSFLSPYTPRQVAGTQMEEAYTVFPSRTPVTMRTTVVYQCCGPVLLSKKGLPDLIARCQAVFGWNRDKTLFLSSQGLAFAQWVGRSALSSLLNSNCASVLEIKTVPSWKCTCYLSDGVKPMTFSQLWTGWYSFPVFPLTDPLV